FTTPNAYQTQNQGGYDAFVAYIDARTGSITASTYVGNTATEGGPRLQIDRDGDIYLLGTTNGNYNISPNAYEINNGNSKLFVQKLDHDLTTAIVSSQYGFGNIFASAFVVDVCKNVYICGMNNSGFPNAPMTQDAYSTQNSNFYFFALDGSLSQLIFGSYFGTTDDHTHTGI